MNRTTLGMVIGLIAVAILGFFGYQRFQAARNTASTTPLETARVERGELIASVSAAGSVEPVQTLALTFKNGGRVAEVLIKQGDAVQQGAVIARLETGELDLTLAQSRAALATAKANLAKAQAGPTAEDLAAAEAGVRAAQAALAQLRVGPTRADVAQAEATLRAAQASYNRVTAGAREQDIESARLSVEQAKNNLWGTQASRDAICGQTGDKDTPKALRPPQADCDRAQAQVQAAEQAVQIAEQNYAKAQAGPTEAEVAAAQAEVDRAQAALNKVREGSTTERIAQAQAEVDRAVAQLNKLKAGATAEDLAALEAAVDQAQAGVALSELRLKDATLTAPVSGTISTVNGKAGELVGVTAPIATLVDVSKLQASLTIDETEISRVKVGQKARITLDAHQGEELTGTVAEIAPTATVQQGVVTYRVKVDLPRTELVVKPGMTANVDIELERRPNALLVPNRAIRTANGQRVVYIVQQEGQLPVETPVRVGLSDDSMTEVLSGVNEGDRVVTQVTPTNNPFQTGGSGSSR